MIAGLRLESVNETASRFEHLFAPAFESWRTLFVVDRYPIRYHDSGEIVEPEPELIERYGAGLHRICPEMALAISHGSAIPHWAGGLVPAQRRTLLFFIEPPACEVIEYYYYMGKRDLARGKWPAGLRDLVQCFDGEFWEIHSQDAGLLDRIAAHFLDDPQVEVSQVDSAP